MATQLSVAATVTGEDLRKRFERLKQARVETTSRTGASSSSSPRGQTTLAAFVKRT